MTIGTAKLRGVDGKNYLISTTSKEDEFETMKRGEEFYGVKMLGVLRITWTGYKAEGKD